MAGIGMVNNLNTCTGQIRAIMQRVAHTDTLLEQIEIKDLAQGAGSQEIRPPINKKKWSGSKYWRSGVPTRDSL